MCRSSRRRRVRLTLLLAAILFAAVAPGAVWAQNCEFPGVLLVVDRSISMLGDIDGRTKWSIATEAIGTLLGTHGDAAHFGLMVYPGPSGLGDANVVGAVGACRYEMVDAGCEPLAPRCSTGEVVVGTGGNTEAAINAALAWPEGLRHSYTPTWQSLEAAGDYPPLRDVNRRDFVILLTDGWQCCGLFENENGELRCEPEDRALLVQRVERLRQLEITAFIVGFGGLVDVESLQNMAVAAGTARAGCDPAARGVGGDNHCYYQADNAAELRTMLDDIVRQIAVEGCDGLDNDCDGMVDEDLFRGCQSNCGNGEEQCFNGQWGDCSADAAAPEICDNVDNDCDGSVDEGLTQPCNTACGPGTETCVAGNWANCDAPQPQAEMCDDDIDNNCDGAVNEGCICAPGDERPCGEDRGACRAGVQRCDNNAWSRQCLGGSAPQAEICNGLDDDCDGQVDGMTRACQSACGAGTETCNNGIWSACDAPQPGQEACNGLDEDCDGRPDNGLSRACQSACGNGVENCVNGIWQDCTATQPAASDICDNGVDDDCDGSIDEMCGCDEGATQPCGTDRGICRQGLQNCRGGVWGSCDGELPGSPEVCNGLDDDCDGMVDDGELCAGGQVCGCGACSDPCQAGECGGDAVCIFGHCLIDECPNGLICIDGVCVPGDDPGTEPTGPGTVGLPDAGTGDGEDDDGRKADDGCQCDVGRRDGPPPWTVLFAFALLLMRRRRRRRPLSSPDSARI